MTGRRELGRRGEEHAVEYLRQRGYRILARNWRTRLGEIDVVAQHGRTLVFVEVRTRASPSHGTASESVGPAKRRRLVLMAEQYLQGEPPGTNARIDVVTIDLRPDGRPDVQHVVGAVEDA